MLTPLSVLWQARTIVAGGPSLTVSLIRDSMSPMRLLWTKCDDAPQSDIMVNFRGPGVAKPAKNETPMPDGGDSMTYGVEAASNLTGVGEAVNGATRVGAMAVGEDVPLAVTAVLSRPVLEPSPRWRLLP